MADDDMLDAAIRAALDGDVPAPRPAARRRAIAAAREAFAEGRAQAADRSPPLEPGNGTQGFFARLRLIFGNSPNPERETMSSTPSSISSSRQLPGLSFTRNGAYGAIAAICIGAVAVGIAIDQPFRVEIPAADPAEEQRRALPTRPDSTGASSLEVLQGQGHPLLDQPDPAGLAVPDAAGTQLSTPWARFDTGTVDTAGKLAVGGLATDAGLSGIRREERAGEAAMIAAQPATQGGAARELASVSAVSLERELAITTQYDDNSTHVMPEPVAPVREAVGRDRFEAFEQNPVKRVTEAPVSTFSADVDSASYSFVRRVLNQGALPPGDAVRAEELINYFDYDYPLPESSSRPFEPTVTVVDSPWADGRKLMHIGIKGYDIEPGEKPRSNLVFLLDVSGSMSRPDRLPLVKQSMEMLLSTLAPEDTVAIVVYAGAAGTVLEPTPVSEKQKILQALRQLDAGGSTAGAQGIRLAYELAERGFDESGVNRVILATDGDFNVGITNDRALQSFIERKRETGIYLSVLGFGRGNFQDALVQTLAQKGNGTAAYIDTLAEAQKVLVDEATSTLFPIADDVKFQVEFNPATVAEYRLIGYETRQLNREDFNNDAVDAGDIGAGHSVTAIYEITPLAGGARLIDDSRYTPAPTVEQQALTAETEYAFLKIRYKLPGEDTSRLITHPIRVSDQRQLAGETGFATAVAGFAQILKGGRYTGQWGYDDVLELALPNRGDDPYGYRSEFIQLVRRAKTAAAL